MGEAIVGQSHAVGRSEVTQQHTPGLEELHNAVLRHVPMDYLRRHDAHDATSPTSACNVAAALKDYADDRWNLIDRLKAEREAKNGLLDALNGLQDILARAESNASGNPEWGAVSKRINAARAAIAKAEDR